MQLVWMPTTTSPTRTTKMLHTKPDEVYVTHATAMRRAAAIADVRRSTLMGGVGTRRLGRARPRKEIDLCPVRIDCARASTPPEHPRRGSLSRLLSTCRNESYIFVIRPKRYPVVRPPGPRSFASFPEETAATLCSSRPERDWPCTVYTYNRVGSPPISKIEYHIL
jgi:hypothetical protein